MRLPPNMELCAVDSAHRAPDKTGQRQLTEVTLEDVLKEMMYRAQKLDAVPSTTEAAEAGYDEAVAVHFRRREPAKPAAAQCVAQGDSITGAHALSVEAAAAAAYARALQQSMGMFIIKGALPQAQRRVQVQLRKFKGSAE